MVLLEQEKFDTIKELSEMQSSISEGRATLSQLKVDTESYLKEREEMADLRVAKVLNESREALESTSKNHVELTSYGNELKVYASTLRGFSTDVVALIHGLREGTEKVNKKIDEHLKVISEAKTDILAQRKSIENDRKQLELERNQIDGDWRELRDRQATFLKGVKEITNKDLTI